MEMALYIIIGIIIGTLIGWLIAKVKATAAIQTEKDAAQQKYSELEKEFIGYKATTTLQLETANKNLAARLIEIGELKQGIQTGVSELALLNNQFSTANADLRAANQTNNEKKVEVDAFRKELEIIKADFQKSNQALATANANNEALSDKLQTQKNEIEALGKKFNTEFENIANKILETKSEKFTELNKTNLTTILEPLGKNITEFKTKVEEVYDKESKERFSLGEKVKELALLNQVISDEARNLTKALKGESKTQGDWGQMILESILEKSGLVKDREYFMEHQLLDENGIPLRSDSEGKKMRPDAVIKYPDNRSVIIDSKVSLNAFTRLVRASDIEEQKKELASHVEAIKTHIVTLSAKGYDDYDRALDFVMMFVPSEPAYIAALQGDADLWNFAYDKRILLLSPTNLITSLKLIVDLWKREYQNQNALEIAERGAKLYDKFVGFIANLSDVGEHLEKAQGKYNEAYKQLSTGNDNLVLQATKLKDLGLKTKKELPKEIANAAISNELAKQTND
jgi:DNA recombination protein RmuC